MSLQTHMLIFSFVYFTANLSNISHGLQIQQIDDNFKGTEPESSPQWPKGHCTPNCAKSLHHYCVLLDEEKWCLLCDFCNQGNYLYNEEWCNRTCPELYKTMMTTVSPAHHTSIRTQESTSLTLKTASNWLDMKGKGLIVLIAIILIVLVGLVVFAALRFTHCNHAKQQIRRPENENVRYGGIQPEEGDGDPVDV